ncbi:MAG: ABC transporter substrate-binding protein [Propionibacteriaceae bacterium]|jgi:raffinose/stachyose/melibiose transport system substrate-binding protein|nr:ABC transporter substrate-binding protein [Propionibacteriaceae bacterium]
MSSNSLRRVAVVATAAGALFLAACSGGSSTTNDQSSAAGAATSEAPAAAGVTLTMWHQSADSDAQLNLYKAYEAYSGNTIELLDLPADTYTTAVQTKWATGDRPDILEYSPAPQDMRQLNMAENMVDLSGLGFVSHLINHSGELDGQVLGVALGPISSYGMFYNKTVFANAGVDLPKNYDDLLDICPTVTATGVDLINVGGGSEFPANMIAGFAYMADYNADDAWGQAVAAGTEKVDDPDGPIVAGLTAVDNLVKAGCVNADVATATFQDSIKAVYDGTAALTILPSDFISQFYDLGDGDTAAVDALVGFAPISAEKGIGSYSGSPIGSYFVPTTGDSAKEAAAQDFIEWATTTGYQDYINDTKSTPTLDTATLPSDLGELYQSLAAILQDPATTPAFNQSVPGFGNFGQLALSVLVGQATPQEAATKWQTFVDQAREAQG